MAGFNQKRIDLILSIALGIVLLICASSYSTFHSYFRSADLREQSFLTLDVIQKILLAITDAETGQRGYLLSGKPSYLEPFETARAKIPNLMSQLRDLHTLSHPDLKGVNELDEVINIKFDELQKTMIIRKEKGATAALEFVNTDRGKNAMDRVRSICAEMIHEETTLLHSREASLVSETHRAVTILFVGTFLTLVLVIGSGWVTGEAMKKRLESEARLIESVKRLNASNRELEQFAYVASHDLQEPLRMVSNYCQLLGRRYKDRLDSDANEFIEFAVSGAQRMQKLIDALLSYSRVESHVEKTTRTRLETCLRDALKNLQTLIAESAAVITYDPLPELDADPDQLTQVFQNLIGNGIKFSANTTPRIHISVKDKDSEWLIGVRDHGIGIDPEYFNRIFVIFQRLHSKQEFPGTGIGLAICKKIVDAHGGKIWVESTPGEGTTFYFTLPRNSLYSETLTT